MVTVSRKEARPVLHPLAHFVNQVALRIGLRVVAVGCVMFSRIFESFRFFG